MIIRSVAELIEELKKLPQDTVPITREPPFDGLRLVTQADGKVLIAPPPWEGTARKRTAA